MATLIDILREHREVVIARYESTAKEIALKEYMNIVIWWFGKHPFITKELLNTEFKSTQEYHIKRACTIADRKANARHNWEMGLARAASMNGESWYRKNF